MKYNISPYIAPTSYLNEIFVSVSLCKTTVPILLGLCRSLGRFCTQSDWLVGKLYPPQNENHSKGVDGKTSFTTTLNNQGFSNFRYYLTASNDASF